MILSVKTQTISSWFISTDFIFVFSLSLFLFCRASDPRQCQRFLRHELHCQLRLCAEEARLGPAGAGQERGQFNAASHETEGTEDR